MPSQVRLNPCPTAARRNNVQSAIIRHQTKSLRRSLRPSRAAQVTALAALLLLGALMYTANRSDPIRANRFSVADVEKVFDVPRARIAFITDAHLGESIQADMSSHRLLDQSIARWSPTAVALVGDLVSDVANGVTASRCDADSSTHQTTACWGALLKAGAMGDSPDSGTIFGKPAVWTIGNHDGAAVESRYGRAPGLRSLVLRVQRGSPDAPNHHQPLLVRLLAVDALDHSGDRWYYHGYASVSERQVQLMREVLLSQVDERSVDFNIVIVHVPPALVLHANRSKTRGRFTEPVCCMPSDHVGSAAFDDVVMNLRRADGTPAVDLVVSGHDHGNDGFRFTTRSSSSTSGGVSHEPLAFLAARHSGFGGYQPTGVPPGVTIVDVEVGTPVGPETVIHRPSAGAEIITLRALVADFEHLSTASSEPYAALVAELSAQQKECGGLVDYRRQSAWVAAAAAVVVFVSAVCWGCQRQRRRRTL
jgi:hypothetical protein